MKSIFVEYKEGERRSNLVVVRSEDAKSDAVIDKKKRNGGIAQLARASALQAEGRRFDSDYLHIKPDLLGRAFSLS